MGTEATRRMNTHACVCKRGLKTLVSTLISSKGDLQKTNATSIFCLLYPLPCKKYIIKCVPPCIPFNSQSTSVPCNPSAGPHMPISVPDYPSAILRLQDSLPTTPASYTEPGPCPSVRAQHHTPAPLLSPAPSTCCSPAVPFLPTFCAALPPVRSHTRTKRLLPIKHFHSAKPHN